MDVVLKAKNLALLEIEKFWLPSLLHFELSEKKWVEIANKLWANVDIVKVWTYLMDLKLWEAFIDGRVKEHIKMSLDSTDNFLKDFKLDKKTHSKILNSVEAHHGTIIFNSIESEICANADCYRFLHPTWILEYIRILSNRLNNLWDILKQVEIKMDEKYEILSLNICKEELKPHYNNFKKYIRETLDKNLK